MAMAGTRGTSSIRYGPTRVISDWMRTIWGSRSNSVIEARMIVKSTSTVVMPPLNHQSVGVEPESILSYYSSAADDRLPPAARHDVMAICVQRKAGKQ